MKKRINRKLLIFYLLIGVCYFLLKLFTSLGRHPDRFFPVMFNNVWAVIYLIALNFILFEYTIPFVLKKRKTIIYNILLGIFLLWIHLMLYSYGSYAWRLLGIQLHIYTSLKVFSSLDNALENQMAYSTGSVFLFAIARHIYNYIRLKQAEQQLRIEKQAAELNYLRSQTNPHFLFNTLNNIYSLARDKSDLAWHDGDRVDSFPKYVRSFGSKLCMMLIIVKYYFLINNPIFRKYLCTILFHLLRRI